MMVWPGWFEDDAGDVMAAEPGKERFVTTGVIAELAGYARRVNMHVVSVSRYRYRHFGLSSFPSFLGPLFFMRA
jgi:hypothetical protein